MAREAVTSLEHLGPPASSGTALALLAEPVRCWFVGRFAEPTLIQRLAWPALVEGRHLLLCAPTGHGKTLAAFLPLLGPLSGPADRTSVRCLYVAPLKALTHDVARNLRRCLREIRRQDPAGGPVIRIGLRTGDTSDRLRRWQRLHPPDLLLTTPESLAVLLGQRSAAGFFRDLRWIVIDEVHALASTKRGADLSLSLERVTALAQGPIQRIGLSATCAPLAQAAAFLTGAGRACAVAQVPDTQPIELTIEPLDETGGSFLARLLERLRPEVEAQRTTLIFTQVRSLAERLVWVMRQRWPAWAGQIGVHHSALAAARRRQVERKLKQGRLRAVVSSTSLELGIDIGCVDGVVLIHPPGSVVGLLQRIGRSGHAPQRPRRGLVLTTSAAELLEAAVTGACGQSGQYDPLRGLAHPLDVLCQHLLGMAAQGPWTAREAFDIFRLAHPYRNLTWPDFENCLAYLCGQGRRGARTEEGWLPVRLVRDGDRFRVVDARTARLIRRNLGTILTQEACPVRLTEGAAVGEVDESFADRLQPGARFLLDGRCLEFRRREERALLVDEVPGHPAVPRWHGSGKPLAPELAQRLYLLRVRAAEALREGPDELARLLGAEYDLQAPAIDPLVAHFQEQERVSEIPDARTCLVEVVPTPFSVEYYVHTPLNRAGNDALARVVVRRLSRGHSRTLTSQVADLGFLLALVRGPRLTAAELTPALGERDFEADLQEAIGESYALRERFRWVALTGLMLLRHPLGGRRRVGGMDWAERRLFEQLQAGDPDFVLLRQARREFCEETCDAAAARAWLEQFPRLSVRWRTLVEVSPFAAAWTQPAAGPFEPNGGSAGTLEQLHESLQPVP